MPTYRQQRYALPAIAQHYRLFAAAQHSANDDAFNADVINAYLVVGINIRPRVAIRAVACQHLLLYGVAIARRNNTGAYVLARRSAPVVSSIMVKQS